MRRRDGRCSISSTASRSTRWWVLRSNGVAGGSTGSPNRLTFCGVAADMQLPARIGLVTLACRDVERMANLFRALGWPETPESDEHHRTFQCTNGVVIGLYAATYYEPDFGPPTDAFRGFTIAVNLESYAETEAVYEALS